MNLECDTSPKCADSEAGGCALEFFSSSHGKWISVDIIERDDQGSVQVSAKPGVWLSAKDCKRKLRARVFSEDPSIGSTIAPADMILQGKVAPKSCTPTGGGVSLSNFKQDSPKDQAAPRGSAVPRPSVGAEPAAGGGVAVRQAPTPQGYPIPDAGTTCQHVRQISEPPRQAPAVTPHLGRSATGSQPTVPTSTAASGQAPPKVAGPTITELPPDASTAPLSHQTQPRHAAQPSAPPAAPKEPSGAAADKRPPVVVAAAPLTGQVKEEPAPVEGLWNTDLCGETDSTRSSEGQRAEGQRAEGPRPGPALVGEAIAFNTRGEPIIARRISEDTGVGVTTVVNEDGTQATFGQNTLMSLMSVDQSDAQSWIGSLSTLETRGLVHEIGRVLLSTSAVYQYHLDRLKQISEQSHYAYFGLSADATLKDIEMAYRKLAKKMHPDKNGGTAEAKERFQQMKERYEALKERRGSDEPRGSSKGSAAQDDEQEECDAEKGDEEKGDAGEDGEKEGAGADGETDEAKPEEPQRKEAYEEDSESEAPKKQSSQISFDPTDQESLVTTAVEMLERLKAIEGGMATVKDQLRRQGC